MSHWVEIAVHEDRDAYLLSSQRRMGIHETALETVKTGDGWASDADRSSDWPMLPRE
ncbi:hypothetical protein Mapa_000381 [Marchantia paleacea]|nr:hypothetical protein Mapa_000381 [Marchantia paleacea]